VVDGMAYVWAAGRLVPALGAEQPRFFVVEILGVLDVEGPPKAPFLRRREVGECLEDLAAAGCALRWRVGEGPESLIEAGALAGFDVRISADAEPERAYALTSKHTRPVWRTVQAMVGEGVEIVGWTDRVHLPVLEFNAAMEAARTNEEQQ
jgi:hypothetical protein